jgi:hypothetical protein
VEGPAAAELSRSGPPATPTRPTGSVAVVAAVAARPRLWPAALRQARALVVPGWWRRRPFLPVPDRAWLRFRMTTAYGDPDARIDVDDLLTWLAWTDTMRTGAEASRPRSARLLRPAAPVGGPDRP